MKINFKELKVTDLTGNEITLTNVHEAVANAVYRQASNSPIRNVELARKIFADGEIELSPEDVSVVVNAITNTSLIGDYIKVALIDILK